MSEEREYKRKSVCVNRRAHFDFSVEEEVEAGLLLTGAEVKALRAGHVEMLGSFARIEGSAAFVEGLRLSYDKPGQTIEPDRAKKLLLTRRQISSLAGKVARKGYTLVPFEVYFKGSWAKVRLCLCTGKKQHDKRAALKEKAVRMDARREETR